ncbi:FAD-dependent oxidoreductase [Hyphobacterium sp. HN65]|uniref:FAD-dependent oxidoreductase n=1 Tax=Hyphobacterium lacteum TaxID=3116575 RepID=A0ABU7LPK7_9PROT|nr:FAD-dependent oxidoreductase [Hyphobacterium sp. HN65]MEE2525848.1 FAD-dependent oxidoreductase [Hyphobacterium sp. HN65]
MELVKLDTVVVGGGVIGLACARALGQEGHSVTVLESASLLGEGISSRNSGVIHAGIYYPPKSKKAFHCVRGRQRLYGYLEDRALSYHRSGKIVVAASETEIPRLLDLKINAETAGVDNLKLVTPSWLKRNEPEIFAPLALLSPDSGWVDATAFIQSLEADIQRQGGQIVLQSKVSSIGRAGKSFELLLSGQDIIIQCSQVVLAAGLGMDQLLAGCPAELEAKFPKQVWARGSYFVLQGKSPFSRHIYPLPVEGGLGVHATLDGSGGVKFGPDVEWLDTTNEEAGLFDVDESRKSLFVSAIRAYWPGVVDAKLLPGYAGIRPKLCGPAGGFSDFGILGPSHHGIENLVCLTGIESPGLTAAFSIADEAVNLISG